MEKYIMRVYGRVFQYVLEELFQELEEGQPELYSKAVWEKLSVMENMHAWQKVAIYQAHKLHLFLFQICCGLDCG